MHRTPGREPLGSSLSMCPSRSAAFANPMSFDRPFDPCRIQRLTPALDLPGRSATSVTLTPNRSIPTDPISSCIFTTSGSRPFPTGTSSFTYGWVQTSSNHSEAEGGRLPLAVLLPSSSIFTIFSSAPFSLLVRGTTKRPPDGRRVCTFGTSAAQGD